MLSSKQGLTSQSASDAPCRRLHGRAPTHQACREEDATVPCWMPRAACGCLAGTTAPSWMNSGSVIWAGPRRGFVSLPGSAWPLVQAVLRMSKRSCCTPLDMSKLCREVFHVSTFADFALRLQAPNCTQPQRGQPWPAPRFYHSAVIANEVMWMFGGVLNGMPSDDLWSFDLQVGCFCSAPDSCRLCRADSSASALLTDIRARAWQPGAAVEADPQRKWPDLAE